MQKVKGELGPDQNLICCWVVLQDELMMSVVSCFFSIFCVLFCLYPVGRALSGSEPHSLRFLVPLQGSGPKPSMRQSSDCELPLHFCPPPPSSHHCCLPPPPLTIRRSAPSPDARGRPLCGPGFGPVLGPGLQDGGSALVFGRCAAAEPQS